MSKAQLSVVNGVVVSVLAALVAFGVVGGVKADAVQGIILSVIPLVSAVAIRSARK